MKGIEFFSPKELKPMAWWLHKAVSCSNSQIEACINQGEDIKCLLIPLSFQVWQRDRYGFLKNIRNIVEICRDKNISVILSIFRRRSGYFKNRGELNLEQILPEFSWPYERGFYQHYFRDICDNLNEYDNIIFWDITDCPVNNAITPEGKALIGNHEHTLRRNMYYLFKGLKPRAPVGFTVDFKDKDSLPVDMTDICDYTLWRDNTSLKLKKGYEIDALTVCEVKYRE